MKYVYLAAGGTVGTLLRYWISFYLNSTVFPAGTFIANISGSFVIGLLAGIGIDAMTPNVRLFAITGLLGGFTTFSSLSLESLTMFQNSQPIKGFLYLGGSCITGLLVAGIGFFLGKYLFHNYVPSKN